MYAKKVILEVGTQGPPGPRGPSGNVEFTVVAAEPIESGKIVKFNRNGHARKATAYNVPITEGFKTLGISVTSAAVAGENIVVRTIGEFFHRDWQFPSDSRIFLDDDGELTAVIGEDAVFEQMIGVVLDSDRVFINIQRPCNRYEGFNFPAIRFFYIEELQNKVFEVGSVVNVDNPSVVVSFAYPENVYSESFRILIDNVESLVFPYNTPLELTSNELKNSVVRLEGKDVESNHMASEFEFFWRFPVYHTAYSEIPDVLNPSDFEHTLKENLDNHELCFSNAGYKFILMPNHPQYSDYKLFDPVSGFNVYVVEEGKVTLTNSSGFSSEYTVLRTKNKLNNLTRIKLVKERSESCL